MRIGLCGSWTTSESAPVVWRWEEGRWRRTAAQWRGCGACELRGADAERRFRESRKFGYVSVSAHMLDAAAGCECEKRENVSCPSHGTVAKEPRDRERGTAMRQLIKNININIIMASQEAPPANPVPSKRWTQFHAALQLAIQRAAHKWTFVFISRYMPAH